MDGQRVPPSRQVCEVERVMNGDATDAAMPFFIAVMAYWHKAALSAPRECGGGLDSLDEGAALSEARVVMSDCGG